MKIRLLHPITTGFFAALLYVPVRLPYNHRGNGYAYSLFGKQFHHSLRLFCVYQFLHLVYPFATAYFHKLSTLLRIHPSLQLICEGVLPLTGAPLEGSASMPVVRYRYAANGFTLLSILNQYRFSSSAHAPVCKSRRLYPGCS